MNFLFKFFRIIIGSVFVISGFTKAIDPIGFSYKIEENFIHFGIPETEGITAALVFLIVTFEFLAGISLVFNVFPKFGLYCATVGMFFFIPYTFYVAISEEVNDCGCFGSRITLTDWQSFWKNVFIGLLLVPLYFRKDRLYSNMYFSGDISIFACALIFILVLSVRSYNHGPYWGIKGYSTGSNLKDKHFMKKDWNGNYQNIFEEKGYIFLSVVPDVDRTDPQRQMEINRLAIAAMHSGHHFYGAVSVSADIAEKYRTENNVPYEFITADEITLKNLIRSGIGIILTKDGTILKKWEGNDLPEESRIISGSPDSGFLGSAGSDNEKKDIAIIILSAIVIWQFVFRHNKKKNKNRYI